MTGIRSAAAGIAVAVLGVLFVSAPADACSNDMKQRVKAAGGCFAIDFVGNKEIAKGEPLVVFIHGDRQPVNRDNSYHRGYAFLFAGLNAYRINAIAIARPTYSVPTGKTVDVPGNRRRDQYIPGAVDGVADALKALKKHYRPSRLVLIGHSGGSMISGILFGRHPGIADGGVLIAWGCDTPTWCQWRIDSAGGGRRHWPENLSAWDYIPKIPAGSVKVIAITGTADRNTLPKFARQCVDAMKKRGIDARLELADGLGHGSVFLSDKILAAVEELLKR
ncbi:MAG: alpha/beta hydrolase [Rhodospirillaceae bacterium]|nr:alpha/beta hydrolase [Rhodospirillaceae bacterium]MYI50437.1 alpha/beta hydrolase [Rhodospirillaceae bacterium]